MTINLEDESTGRSFAYPKLDKEGDVWVGMLIDFDSKAPLYDYRPPNSTAPRHRSLSPDGKEKTQDLLTFLLLDKTTCRVSLPDDDGDAVGREAAGTVARFFVKGHNRWTEGRADSFREAKEKHGTLQVGDVVWGKLVSIDDVGNSNPKKTISFGLRKPKPEEAPLVQRCVEEHQRLRAVDLEPAASGGSSAPSYEEEEPF